MSGVDAYTLGALLQVRPERIRQWKHRGLIHATGRDQRGRTLYDPAEVAACADSATRRRQSSSRLSDPSVTVTPAQPCPPPAR